MSKKATVVTTTKTNAKPKAKLTFKKKNVQPVSQPEASSKTKKPTAKPEGDKVERNGVNIGKTSGMRVMAFQDETLRRNDDPKYRLTDTELAAVWRAEFPNSRAVLNGRIDESIVRGVRNLYNQGTAAGGHGGGQTHASKPYIIENGKRVTSEYTRARKPEADEAETVVATAAPKGPARVKTAKGQTVVVARRKAKAA